MDDAARAPLEALVGTWDVEVTFPGSGPMSGARTTFEWALDRQFLLQRSEVPVAEAPDGLCVIAGAGAPGAYMQHYFDSRGVVRVYGMRLHDGRWTLLRDRPDFSELGFQQRFLAEIAGDTITGRWETSDDGSEWKLDFEMTYRRYAGPGG